MTKLYYFAGRGRAETTRWMLAACEINFVNVPVSSAEELAQLRASNKLPFGQLPLLEIDHLRLSQSTAMIRFLARRGGFYGNTPQDAMWCDMIAGAVADFAETGLQAAFQPTVEAAIESQARAVAKFAPYFNARLDATGSGWLVCDRMTFADVVMAEALTNYLEWSDTLLAQWPGLASLQARVIKTAGVAAYLDSPQRWPMSRDDYVLDVSRVLQRRLPAHMPDAERFVVR